MTNTRIFQSNKVLINGGRGKEDIGYSRGKWRPICHYCDKPGHIRPNCRSYHKDKREKRKRKIQKKWVRKLVPVPVPVADNVGTVEEMSSQHDPFAVDAAFTTKKIISFVGISRSKHNDKASEFLDEDAPASNDAPAHVSREFSSSRVTKSAVDPVSICNDHAYVPAASEERVSVSIPKVVPHVAHKMISWNMLGKGSCSPLMMCMTRDRMMLSQNLSWLLLTQILTKKRKTWH